MTRIARIDVDTQNGFMDPKGGLYVQGSEGILAAVAQLNSESLAKGHVLIGSVDTHEPMDKEFKAQGGPWPVHCVKGTWDWLKHPASIPNLFDFVSMSDSRTSDRLITSAMFGKALYFEKNVYSIFDNQSANGVIACLAVKDYTFEVYGVATDYCVKAAALGIKQRYPSAAVCLLTYACAGVDSSTILPAIEEMKKAGIEIIR